MLRPDMPGPRPGALGPGPVAAALDALDEGLLIVGDDGAPRCNPAARRLLGADPTAVPRERWESALGLHAPDGAPFAAGASPLARALAGERVERAEMAVWAGDGARAWVTVTGGPIAGGAFAVVRDAGASRAASANEAFLEAIVENIPDMIFVKDARELRFVRFNRAGEELLGYARADLIGRNDYDFFTREEADFFTSKDRAVLAGKTVLDIPEEPIHTRHGVRLLHTKKIPILDADGTPRYLLGISEDVTEARRAQEALAASRARQEREQAAREAAEEAVRLRDEFLSIASHELRAPVTSLQFAVQATLGLARRGPLADLPQETVVEALETAARQARRLARLIDLLLDVSRIHAGRLQIGRAAVDLVEVAGEAARRARLEPAAAAVAITLVADGPVIGQWDAARLEQVVTNLLDNALKYGGGEPVEVRVRGDATHAWLAVADRGIGIAPERQERIFERFERAASSEHYGGLGLGLYIVRRIVDAFGGTITVASAPGTGSTFTVELPREPRPRSIAPAEPYTPPPAPAGGGQDAGP